MDKFVNDVFSILIKILPADWGKIVLRAVITQNSHTILFFVQDKVSKKYYSYVDMQRMEIFTKQEFQNICVQIGEVSRAYQNTFEKEWTGYTLVITQDGKTSVDLDYEKPSITVPESWKNNYLK